MMIYLTNILYLYCTYIDKKRKETPLIKFPSFLRGWLNITKQTNKQTKLRAQPIKNILSFAFLFFSISMPPSPHFSQPNSRLLLFFGNYVVNVASWPRTTGPFSLTIIGLYVLYCTSTITYFFSSHPAQSQYVSTSSLSRLRFFQCLYNTVTLHIWLIPLVFYFYFFFPLFLSLSLSHLEAAELLILPYSPSGIPKVFALSFVSKILDGPWTNLLTTSPPLALMTKFIYLFIHLFFLVERIKWQNLIELEITGKRKR